MKDSYYLSEPNPNPDIVFPTIRVMAYLSPDFTALNEMNPRHQRYMLNRIEVARGTDKGQGWGTKLLEQICRDADQENVALLLGVSPDDDAYFERLVGWYRRHGFVAYNAQHDYDVVNQVYNVMIRVPSHKDSPMPQPPL